MLNESENDGSECELVLWPAKKKVQHLRSVHTSHLIGESLNPK